MDGAHNRAACFACTSRVSHCMLPSGPGERQVQPSLQPCPMALHSTHRVWVAHRRLEQAARVLAVIRRHHLGLGGEGRQQVSHSCACSVVHMWQMPSTCPQQQHPSTNPPPTAAVIHSAHLEAGHAGVPGRKALAVLRCHARRCTVGAAEHDGACDLASAHVMVLGRRVDNLHRALARKKEKRAVINASGAGVGRCCVRKKCTSPPHSSAGCPPDRWPASRS